MKNCFYIIFFLISSNIVLGHKNVSIEKKFGNIKLISSTAYISDETNINFIIGKYAEILSNKLNYKDTILLYLSTSSEVDLNCYFTSKRNRIESGEFIQMFIRTKNKEIGKTLNILEFLILNKKNKKLLKKTYKEKKLYEIYNKNYSKLILGVLSIKIERLNEFEKLNYPCNISYFVKDDKIVFYEKNEKTLIELVSVNSLINYIIINEKYLIITKENKSIELVFLNNYKDDLNIRKIKTNSIYLNNLPLIYYPYKINLIEDKYISFENGFIKEKYFYDLEKEILLDRIDSN